jgi:predicted N-formylglutamate amidohydrolase
MKNIALVVSCEHAVNAIPEPYTALFSASQDLLNTHYGIDFGAFTIAEHLKEMFDCELISADTSRLLIDCNRSLYHKQCFSELSQKLPLEEKQRIIHQYYLPFRQEVMDLIKNHLAKGAQVWHLSIHSFTPIMHGVVRNADIGLLYDSRRITEKVLAKQWQDELKKQAPQYRVRRNYPYTGRSDGFTSMLRKQWPEEEYVGIELESNQALALKQESLTLLKKTWASTLKTLFMRIT